MRTLLAVLAVAAALVPAPAHADLTEPNGIGCGRSYTYNPGAGGDMVLVLKGGPIAGPVAADGAYQPDPALSCTLTIDREGHPLQTFTVTSTNAGGVAVVVPVVTTITVGNGSTDRRVDTMCQTLTWTDPYTGEPRSKTTCSAQYYNHHPELP